MADKEKEILRASVSKSLMSQTANNEFGMTQEYNKINRDKLWDDSTAKSGYKDKIFEDKATYKDPISGKLLHKSQTAAQNKYHMRNDKGEKVSKEWAKHSSETDHINALKDVHNVAKHNPVLSDEDFKRIMNSDENYRLLSKSFNASKGEKSDWGIILDKDNGLSAEARVQMAKEKVSADIALHGKFATCTVEKVGEEFVSGATDTVIKSAIPLMAEGVRKMCKVAAGEESLSEATKDMAKTTVNVAVIGGTNKLVLDVVNQKFKNSSNEILCKLANSNVIAPIISVALIINESSVKYVNGEIDEKQFFEEIGEKGTVMVTGMISGKVGKELGLIIGSMVGTAIVPGVGTAAGAIVGEILGTIITTVACTTMVCVYNTAVHFNDYKLKEEQVKKIEEEAIKEIRRQRERFKSIIETEYKYWDEQIQEGFDMILKNSCECCFDVKGVTDGLDKILALFGTEAKFHSLEEYENQIGNTLKFSF